jgi:hypothetical protein
MSKYIKYVIGFTMAVSALQIWFMAIGADSHFEAIYAAISGLTTAIAIEGRKKVKARKNDKKR